MKDDCKGKINIELVGLNWKMYFLVNVDIKKEKESIVVFKTQDIKNILMFWLIKKYWDPKWKEFRVNCIKLLLILFVWFHCPVLMIKDKY